MKIRNVSGHDRTIAATGQHVDAGDTADVDDDLGKALCAQPDNWEPIKAPTTTKKKGDA